MAVYQLINSSAKLLFEWNTSLAKPELTCLHYHVADWHQDKILQYVEMHFFFLQKQICNFALFRWHYCFNWEWVSVGSDDSLQTQTGSQKSIWKVKS